ncbi:ribonuclease HII [Adhaeribacter radiodurans]|uniref:Ribonuclease HII n=1 Tax=Adhaeribacter radiodurans TaxID=2745197 RepID=A0A7L7LF44_9BACT|nr:ribonuclease HII [Adhaeribacter radiodurans]QMU31482.1 ribonuclease HII [Adhaeribacter radiodurans]
MLLANYSGHKLEAGLDEAGRGCLAGPVIAAAVILPPDYYHPTLNDSKQLTKKQRENLREEICREAISWAVGEVSSTDIDLINISKASFLAMHQAVAQLQIQAEYLIVDGNQFIPYPGIPHACIVKGDSKYFSIAAASVLAKTFRDDIMTKLAEQFPGYGWEQNAGYPTRLHRSAIQATGTTPYHRLSFRLLPESFIL